MKQLLDAMKTKGLDINECVKQIKNKVEQYRKIEQEILNDNIKTKIETTVAPDEPVEIRSLILENLGKITGEFVTDDIINEIFSKFCLGK